MGHGAGGPGEEARSRAAGLREGNEGRVLNVCIETISSRASLAGLRGREEKGEVVVCRSTACLDEGCEEPPRCAGGGAGARGGAAVSGGVEERTDRVLSFAQRSRGAKSSLGQRVAIPA